ncbi:MAG: hypothetical protein ACOYL5_13230 [Phototrophicaceae bacterium]
MTRLVWILGLAVGVMFGFGLAWVFGTLERKDADLWRKETEEIRQDNQRRKVEMNHLRELGVL